MSCPLIWQKGSYHRNESLQSHDTKWCDDKSNICAWFRFINVGILSMLLWKKKITKQLGRTARWIWTWGGRWKGRIHLRRTRWIWNGMRVRIRQIITQTQQKYWGYVRWGTLYYKYEKNYFKFNLRGDSEVVKKQCSYSFEWHIADFYEELKENLFLTFFGGCFWGWWWFWFF